MRTPASAIVIACTATLVLQPNGMLLKLTSQEPEHWPLSCKEGRRLNQNSFTRRRSSHPKLHGAGFTSSAAASPVLRLPRKRSRAESEAWRARRLLRRMTTRGGIISSSGGRR